MAYTTINKATDYFSTNLYTGNGSNGYSISGVGHQPDFVWIKSRSAGSTEHHLMDVLQGWGTGSSDTPNISSNSTSAAYNRNIFSSNNVNADGFELNDYSDTNTNSQTHVAWSWKGGGAGSANTDGSINSTVSANTTSGFSIVKYTGTGANATVGHGLGVAPKMILVKKTSGSADDWLVYHSSIGATKYMKLNNTVAATSASVAWNDTEPTTTVFSLGSSSVPNASGEDYIAYCFAEKQGYSKIGSYKGNGNASGIFLYTGFRPAWIMVKATDSDQWRMYDHKRANAYNVINVRLKAHLTDAESQDDNECDFLSNGIKWRSNSGGVNTSGQEYTYIVFGQSLVGSNNVPCTAR
jgi:hypothetical protein